MEEQLLAVSLTDVETAISAIQTGGQSVTVDGMTYSAANLSALVALRKQLQAETERSGGTRPLFRAFKMSGMGY